jgi:hypothetical protein
VTRTTALFLGFLLLVILTGSLHIHMQQETHALLLKSYGALQKSHSALKTEHAALLKEHTALRPSCSEFSEEAALCKSDFAICAEALQFQETRAENNAKRAETCFKVVGLSNDPTLEALLASRLAINEALLIARRAQDKRGGKPPGSEPLLKDEPHEVPALPSSGN